VYIPLPGRSIYREEECHVHVKKNQKGKEKQKYLSLVFHETQPSLPTQDSESLPSFSKTLHFFLIAGINFGYLQLK
jgi:hypothetical protein